MHNYNKFYVNEAINSCIYIHLQVNFTLQRQAAPANIDLRVKIAEGRKELRIPHE